MSTITTNCPISTSARRRPWGFWATLAWSGVALAAGYAMTVLVERAYALGWEIAYPGHAPALIPLQFLMLVAIPSAAVLVLVLAARLAGFAARDYLGLVWPHGRHLLIGFGLLAAFGALFVGLLYMFPSLDQSAHWIVVYRFIMGDTAALVLFWTFFVVIAPAIEELFFRGFLMRGWSETRLGVAGTIMLTSLIFAAIHTHHGLIGMALVFMSATLFGVMRWQSGSTVLPIMMHAARNLAVGAWVAMSV
jgi:membrane protease YdiL (CAAX protease family)